MSNSRLPVSAALATAAILATSTAALAANAIVTQDSYVYKNRSTSSAKVNFVEEDEFVTVTECVGTYCFIKIPGPDGWIRKNRLAPLDSGGKPHTDIPFSFGLTIGPDGKPSISFGIGNPPPPGPGPGAPRACFFQNAGYGGASFCVAAGDGLSNLSSIGWNDKISSVRLYGGAEVQVCRHAGYGSPCTVWSTNKSSLGSWNNQISSLEVY